MPATDSEPASMEDPHALGDEEGSSNSIPSSLPPTTIPSSTCLDPATTIPNFPCETMTEKKAISMASNDCASALSSPTEASPAKPAATSPTAFEGTGETRPATSHIASASDSLTCTKMSLDNKAETPQSFSAMPATTFGSSDRDTDFPNVLTFKGVSVTLENNSVWKQFNSCGTEMILTKPGRRMFPYCRYRLSGLDPERQYSLVLSIVPTDQYRYRWGTTKWETSGSAENQNQGLIRAFSHHNSPCRGSDWMGSLVSFYKLKLTNSSQDQVGHIILHSMHRYIPRLHVIPVPDGDVFTPDQPVVVGPESMTFTFPQTEFMAVTTYQNFRITQLKINHNPFAKGFREDGNNSRLLRVTTEAHLVVKTDTQPPILKSAELTGKKEQVVALSTKKPIVSASLPNEQETRLVLKPIMSTSSNKDEPYVPCIRGKHALGELVLVQKRPLVEPKEETDDVTITITEIEKSMPVTPTSLTSTPGSSPGYRKRRKRINKRWANSRGREWKAATTSPTLVHSSSLTVAMQPELDDVEGLMFVSFTSKEALEVHVGDKPATCTPASPVSLTTPIQFELKVDVIPETDEEKIARLEAILLHDLRVLKHRQVIHPVLQEVGLKLCSLDPTKSIDLQYLGVRLPLPLPNLPEKDNAMAPSPGDEGLSFISRTGKTSDMTKIKGWRNKFIRSKETTPHCDGSQKNLSAFCSNMLDEYLESEAQYISERADAFSTNTEGAVSYQLPVKSSSYVKTLDSVLKLRKAASQFTVGANRPCPLSHKPHLYSALVSPPPPVASPATPVEAGARSRRQSASSPPQRGAQGASEGFGQRPAVSASPSQWTTHRFPGLNKVQLKLLEMEFGALTQGLRRTQLTPDRLSVALSVMLTKQMLPSEVLKTQRPKYKTVAPECGQEFCTLGCVCSSLQHLNRGPLHCRRPECMFGCACFKRKITKQLSAGEPEQVIQPVYSVTNMEHVVQPRPGSHSKKLWNQNILDVDREPLYAPESAAVCLFPLKIVKRSSIPRPKQTIREEDKDPVYKYFESLMTCARVREFNSKPPPEVTLEPKVLDTSTPIPAAKPQKTTTTTENLLKNYHKTTLSVEKAEKAPQRTVHSDETKARKQIEIQSACQWDKDSKMVLEALCGRMNQNRLSRLFWVGPYCVRPIAKIFMRKPSGSIVTYRLHISKPSKASDNDEDADDDSDEEKHADKSFDGDVDAEEDEEESEMRFGVTPFLSGVLPAGRLRARTKPVGCQACGLIQVNGKSYNQARLLLGNMGSLHPANRLAAFVTGRLRPPANVSLKNSQHSDPANKINNPGPVHIKAAGTVVPPIITARKSTDLKAPAQPPVPIFQPDSWKKGSINTPQPSQTSATFKPFVSGQHSSTSSPVSLTVSPSLKTPSFLGQSGTYSFRICPPANQGTRGQNLPGVTLPGGFTLIQLPKPGADGASSESVNTTNQAAVDKAQPEKDTLLNSSHLAAGSDANWLGLRALNRARDPSSSKTVEPGSSSEVNRDEKTPSNETDSGKVESNLDIASEDLSSDSSDYCGDEDDEVLDIETVEEVAQKITIAEMKEAALRALMESRESSDGFASARKLQDQMYDELIECKDKRRRTNHTVLERQRRGEQRILFDKLQAVLQSDPRAPRLRLLSLAVKEIQNLSETSRSLEEKKRRLLRMQSIYLKELSLLSGKPGTMIKHKVQEICERQREREQKREWRPFFSQLLQSRAAFLQATTPQSKVQATPLLQPDFCRAPSQAKPPSTEFQKKIMSLLQSNLESQSGAPPSLFSPAQAGFTVPSLQGGQHPTKVEGQQEIPDAPPVKVSMLNSQAECSVAAKPQVAAAQDKASPASSTPSSSKPPLQPPKAVSLPLIRSKTGRIILPSSLKPIGHGFYTLVVMEPKQKAKEGEVSSSADMKSSDVDSKKQDKSLSECDHPSDSESGHILEDKTKPKCPGAIAPLAELALLNKSIFKPPVALQAVKNSQQGGTAVGLEKILQTACLNFTRVKPVPVPDEPDSSPPVARRGRGRPRVNPVSAPGSANEKLTVVENTSESEAYIPDGEKQIKTWTLESTKTQAEDSPGMVNDNPVPVKRGRGRPPRSKSAQLWSPPALGAGSSPLKSNEDSPVTIPRKSPGSYTLHGDVRASRPLTRGALGKDFPSAKKRSWIDVEKELEPELESE